VGRNCKKYALGETMPGIEFKRFRRIRNNPVLRNMVRETRLNLDDLIYPLFAYPGENIKNEIKSMPGVYQFFY
jgi:porphobilinogen synthase